MMEDNLQTMNKKDTQNGPPFIPGLILAEGFFFECVKPVLEFQFPGLRYSAGLIGTGSEVLGFDTEMSMDHHWGPGGMLFLDPADFEKMKDRINSTLSQALPTSYQGYSTNFSPPNPEDHGTQLLQPVSSGPVNHRVYMFTLSDFFLGYMNLRIDRELTAVDWLSLPQQKLRSIVSGRVFHDDLGLEGIRARLAWYPRDVWLYILASLWKRIGQEEHLMGRAGYVGDEVGSALIGSRLVRDIMRLAFIMEKQYPPYAKWLGTAFKLLKSSEDLLPHLDKAIHAKSWKGREAGLVPAYEILARMHNALGITEPLSEKVSQFWGRPFKVIGGETFVKAIIQSIEDPDIKVLAQKRQIGSVDFFSDSTDLLDDASLRPPLTALYQFQPDKE